MKRMMQRLGIAGIALVIAFARTAGAATLMAVEYYNATLDHYFVTASADEIAKLDAGAFAGWARNSVSPYSIRQRQVRAPCRCAASTAARLPGSTRTSTPRRPQNAPT